MSCVPLLTTLILLTMLNMKTTCKRQKLRMDYTDSCPSMCKCSINSPNTNNNDSMFNMKKNMIANYAEMNYSILARCWITSDLIFLECTPKWNILHLQILNDYKEYSKDLKYTNNDIHIEPSINLFHKCKSIERLAIWEKSQINYLSNSLFKPLTNLTRLIIQLPMLYYLPSHFLIFMPQLTFLMISKSPLLKRISYEVFEPCPRNLKILWLNGNGLEELLMMGLFQSCDLHELWLNENKLKSIPVGSLNGLENLQYLRLDHNNLYGSLEEVMGVILKKPSLYDNDDQYSALYEVKMLKFLDLSFNRITSIQGYLWSGLCSSMYNKGLCHLEHLRLEYNELIYLAPNSFIGLPKLRKLTLSGNLKLYSPEGIMSLTLSLHSLVFSTKYLDEVLIPIKNEAIDTLNICQVELDESRVSLIDKWLKSIIIELNHSRCHKHDEWNKELPTEQTTSLIIDQSQTFSPNVTKSTRVHNTFVSNLSEYRNRLITYVRNSTEMELVSIFVGLACFGVVLGSSVVVLIWYLTRPRMKTIESGKCNKAKIQIKQSENRSVQNYIPLTQIPQSSSIQNISQSSTYIHPYHQMQSQVCYQLLKSDLIHSSTGNSIVYPLIGCNSLCHIPTGRLMNTVTTTTTTNNNKSNNYDYNLSHQSLNTMIIKYPSASTSPYMKQPDLLCSPTMESSISESVYSLGTNRSTSKRSQHKKSMSKFS